MFLHLNSFFQTVTLFYFLLKNMNGGKNNNKIMCMHFYFYFNFWKNKVGCPKKQKIKKFWPYWASLQVICINFMQIACYSADCGNINAYYE